MILAGAVALALAAAGAVPAAEPGPGTIDEAIRAIAPPTAPGLPFGNLADVRGPLAAFYAARAHAPAWSDEAGRATAQARAIAGLLARAAEKGLDPADYDGPRWLGDVARLAGGRASPAEVAAFDVGLTASLMRYAATVRHGQVDPRTLGMQLDPERKALDLPVLAARLAEADDPAAELAALEPALPAYGRLLAALARYRELRDALGDAPVVPRPRGAAPSPGDLYPHAGALAARLLALGDLPASEVDAASEGVYTPGLADAVARFQARHGLLPDGRLGRATAEALDVPFSRRVRQLELALERWRWLPPAFEPPLLVVNVPAFRLVALVPGEAGEARLALAMDVIVGDEFEPKRTPIFASRMDHVVFSPYWEVPREIVRRELVPKVGREPEYFEERGFFVEAPEGFLPVTRATLRRVLAGRARLRQAPGPRNALGGVKFVAPNEFGVYLHDTPERELFRRTDRALSHGCVRVEDAAALAELVLRDVPGWDRPRIEAAMTSGDQRAVKLRTRPWVFILYATAYADADGTVHFHRDVYGHDSRLDRALATGGPSSALAPAGRAGARGAAPGVAHQVRKRPLSTWTKPDAG